MIGGRGGKHAFCRNTSFFSGFAGFFESRNQASYIFPHKCCAQSVMAFFSFGVFIYMYVIFLSGKKWPTVMELVPLKNLIILIL